MGRGRALLVARVVGTRSYRQVMSKVAALKKKGPVVELTSEPAEATEEQKAAIHEAQYQAPTMLSGTTNLRTTWADVTVDDVDAFLSEMPLWDEAVPSTVDTSGVVSTTSTTDDVSMYDIGFQEPCAQENVAPFETTTPVHVATGSTDDADADWLWKALLSSRHAQHVA
ncbi:hypothetical protein SDRG_05152 [Saprolegnia diclina VS20]|uniref:Uncharacterized protein n=1 Tax=Saprolegnia diclina (strain VS20) TaxID=1156394 RepID=T0RYC4_SAPDV|nr:hypothetical protein SDRG_05152 [Saprolegnia diclina VS20]EQC37553.1 hypothetical protein SDRG_05152 [Saprolegnia diclina VS20]|eukprot:XP_008609073.1 hypothetical protein SDRG_05152 [Saprolegnia diclina VS20]